MMPIRISILICFALLSACAGDRAPLTAPAGAAATLAIADWSAARRIEVTLESFDFTPDTLRLQKGGAYLLHLDNSASGGHNFDAPEFFATVALAGGAVERKLRSDGGVIEVEAGHSKDIRLIPLKAGTFRLICSHPLHETFGMHGKIVVK